MIVWSNPARLAIVDLWASRAFPDAWTMRLFGNDFLPDRTSVMGDFVECSYPGYFAVPVNTFLDATFDDDGNALSLPLLPTEFRRGAPPGPEEIAYGWYLTNTEGQVVASERFPAEAHFKHPGDDVLIRLPLRFGTCPLES